MTQDRTAVRYWRSLDELADTPDFRRLVEREFPSLASELTAPHSRRAFLKVMGASLAMAGLTACRWPRETIVPATRQPVDRVPGVPVQYATAMELGGVASGLLVTSVDGRPIKIEGNDKHPFSRGKTNAWQQASVLDLYDPDRITTPTRFAATGVAPESWDAFDAWLKEQVDGVRSGGGEGLAILHEPTSSPTFTDLKQRVRDALPRAEFFEYEPLSRDNERDGAVRAFGRPLRSHVDLTRADIIVSLDCDFLMMHPAAVRLAGDFASRRRAEDGAMSRVYAFESNYTVTGSNADVRVPTRSSAIADVAFALLRGLEDSASHAAAPGVPDAVLHGLLEDLRRCRGRAVVMAGPQQPAAVHHAVHAINARLDAFGRVMTFTDEPDAGRPSHIAAIQKLTERLNAGGVKLLLILGGNPAYSAPGDVKFAAAIGRAAASAHLSLIANETSRLCAWCAPQAHYLEAWADARAWNGLVSIVQPLISPLFGGRTPAELLARIAGDAVTSPYELVRRTLTPTLGGGDIESRWNGALHGGVVDGTAWALVPPPSSVAPPEAPRPRDDAHSSAHPGRASNGPSAAASFELVFAPDYKTYDGRFANNGWLQELPDPITKLAWDNAALIAPADAKALGVDRNGRMLRIEVDGAGVVAPAYILPGHARGSITLPLGYGRGDAAGKVGSGVGVDAAPVRVAAAPWIVSDATVSLAAGEHTLISTQNHHAMESALGDKETDRRVSIFAREVSLADYAHHPEAVKHPHPSFHLPQAAPLWEDKQYDKHNQWGMAIDLTACIGCGACAVACQAENNIPVVGKDEVALGREMSWLRIDRYFRGAPEADDVQMVHQPMMCVHCETAPCEQVCPVGATVHDEEGLNLMVYNRCIGTRYCSNNCPYKVRRFNWYYNQHGPYHPRSLKADAGAPTVGILGPTQTSIPGKNHQTPLTELEKLGKNPQVTVRSRGVMEKCTYCLQRISDVKIKAKNAGWERIPDGAIQTACQQACPTSAIVFGDLSDPGSAVSRLHQHNRAYVVLEELNVRPRTKYLARLKNPAGEAEHA